MDGERGAAESAHPWAHGWSLWARPRLGLRHLVSTASLTAGSGRLRTCGQPRALCRRTVPRRRRRTHHPWGRLPRGEQGIGTRRGRAQPVPLCLRVPGTLDRTNVLPGFRPLIQKHGCEEARLVAW